MLIDNNKVIDISTKKIAWYVNNNLIGSGVGMTTATFLTDTTFDKSYSVRALIQGYNLKNVEGAVGIPLSNQSASISLKEIAGRYVYTANPFFFNTQSLADLLFTWAIQGKYITQEERSLPGILQLEKIENPIAITIQDRINTNERATFEKRN